MGEPVIWLRGKRVGIGPLRADLVPAYWEWENDPGAIFGYGHQVRTAEFIMDAVKEDFPDPLPFAE